MGKIVEIRDLKIGDGVPKICVPVIGTTKEEILTSAKAVNSVAHDLVEWRVDWFKSTDDFESIAEILISLRETLKNTPLLFTFRSAGEGGETEIDKETYFKLNSKAIETGLIDLIDVELFMGDELVKHIIEKAHELNVKVVVSSHDFERTPAKKEIIARLTRMQNLGADIPKLAVMPLDTTDVLTLLSATEEMSNTYATCPIVTMSMGKIGVLSRISGEFFGSAITFGSATAASAPGQIPAEELYNLINQLHKYF